MKRSPLQPWQLILFILVLIALFVIIQLGLFRIAAIKLGIPGEYAVLVLFTSLLGSSLNIPLFKLRSEAEIDQTNIALYGWLFGRRLLPGYVIVTINVGGAIVPIAFSLFLIIYHSLSLLPILLVTTIVSFVSYMFSRPVKGLGIAMSIFIAPVTAALFSIVFTPETSPSTAYISGSLGVLIGADLFRINNIRTMATPIASIGGAGQVFGLPS